MNNHDNILLIYFLINIQKHTQNLNCRAFDSVAYIVTCVAMAGFGYIDKPRLFLFYTVYVTMFTKLTNFTQPIKCDHRLLNQQWLIITDHWLLNFNQLQPLAGENGTSTKQKKINNLDVEC